MESKVFKDISMTFESNPLTDDIIAIKNVNAIVRSIKNIIYTVPGESFFNESFGSELKGSLFEVLDDINGSIIEDEIKSSLDAYEPRIKLIKVRASPNYDENTFNMLLQYHIIGVKISYY